MQTNDSVFVPGACCYQDVNGRTCYGYTNNLDVMTDATLHKFTDEDGKALFYAGTNLDDKPEWAIELREDGEYTLKQALYLIACVAVSTDYYNTKFEAYLYTTDTAKVVINQLMGPNSDGYERVFYVHRKFGPLPQSTHTYIFDDNEVAEETGKPMIRIDMDRFVLGIQKEFMIQFTSSDGSGDYQHVKWIEPVLEQDELVNRYFKELLEEFKQYDFDAV